MGQRRLLLLTCSARMRSGSARGKGGGLPCAKGGGGTPPPRVAGGAQLRPEEMKADALVGSPQAAGVGSTAAGRRAH